jgi:hypothetical protein
MVAFLWAVHLYANYYANWGCTNIELRFLSHLIWSSAKFAHRTIKVVIYQNNKCWEKQRAFSLGPPKWLLVPKDTLPSLSEWRSHLFEFWAITHQPSCISIGKL